MMGRKPAPTRSPECHIAGWATLAALVAACANAGHTPDNGDGTYSNPVMPNAHWSDPSVVRVGTSYFVVTSSIETTPQMQILESTDLVNWDVVGSVLRHWPATDPVTGLSLGKAQCWSPRIMHVNGVFRVMWHSSGAFLVAEAPDPRGPWALIKHNLTGMGRPYASPQWAATTFVDDADGSTYVFAANWIQKTDAAALNWAGPRTVVADMAANGVGLMENPSLMKRNGYYYWHESSNGTVTWGLSPDPNGGPLSSNKGLLSVWRARDLAGPWEGPRHVVKSNVDFACVNTGTVVLGPDNATWYYVYDAIEARRWSMQRQMMLDRLEWDDDDDNAGWPLTVTPSRRRPVPPGAAPRKSGPWAPDLSDGFDGPGLEGVTTGVLGRKWLFKQEDPTLWSLTARPGWLTLNATCVGMDSFQPANLLLQRPTSSYFSLETLVEWVGPCGPADGGGGSSGGGSSNAARSTTSSQGQKPSLEGSAADTPAADAACGADVKNDTDYFGSDILPDSQRLVLPSPSACCDACRNRTGCVAWSYAERNPTDPSMSMRCYLKWSVPAPRAQAGIVSGLVAGRAPPIAPGGSGHAGLVARELNSGSSAAVGVVCDPNAGVRVAFWQDTLNLAWQSPFVLPAANRSVHLRLDVDLVRAQAWWSPTGDAESWNALAGDGDGEERFSYTSTRLPWELVHAGAGGRLPSTGLPTGQGGEGGEATTANEFMQADSFTTMHPGLFAGGATAPGSAAHFAFFRHTDNEVFAT